MASYSTKFILSSTTWLKEMNLKGLKATHSNDWSTIFEKKDFIKRGMRFKVFKAYPLAAQIAVGGGIAVASDFVSQYVRL